MKKNFLLLISILLLLATQPAFAYIDPGSGSAILSVIIGLLVAIGATIKTYWYKILKLFGKSKTKINNDFDKKDID